MRQRVDGPSRTLKNLYQEAGIAAWQRRRLPLVYLGWPPCWTAVLICALTAGC